MDFRDYTYIKAIAEHKTISKAAELLYISQPSLSKYLQNLEERIGTPLFKRVNKQFYPTYAGEQFLEAGEKILSIQNNMNRKMEKILHQESGKINIAVTSVRGYYILPKLFPEFTKKYPGYKINILDRSMADVEKSLENAEADLGIYILKSPNPQFQNHHIRSEEVVLCLSHDNPYKEKAVHLPDRKYPWLDLKLLEHELFFVNDPNKWRISKISDILLKEAGISPEVSILGNLETCLSLASAGMGATFSFDICVSNFKNYAKPPCYYSVGKERYSEEFVLACRKRYVLSEAEQYFLDLLKQFFGDQVM